MATHPARRGWSYAEFARLPDDGNRYEVIDGDLHVTPAPRPLHQRVAFKLGAILESFVDAHRLGWVVTGPIDVLFGERDYFEPDLVYVAREHASLLTERGIEGPPDLVVEVLSRSTALRDRGIKRDRYAFFGVPEYWVVDVALRRVEVHRFREGREAAPLIATDAFDWHPAGPGGPRVTVRMDDFMRGFD
jgi:Uma2 family endonuclease